MNVAVWNEIPLVVSCTLVPRERMNAIVKARGNVKGAWKDNDEREEESSEGEFSEHSSSELKQKIEQIVTHEGEIKTVLRNLGPEYMIDQAIQVLTREYEGVANSDVVFKEFYQLKQEKNERVQVFLVRFREALNKLTLRFPDRVPTGDEDQILCDCFFYGMKPELKSSVRHLFDSSEVSFSTLLTAARRNELEELEQKPVRVQNRAAKIEVEEKTSPQTESINNLKEQIQELATVMKSGSVTHKPNTLQKRKVFLGKQRK